MRKIIEETEEKEGLEGLLGERVTIFACRYIYTGKLIGIDDTSIKLTDCGIVYETGELKDKEWKDYQELPNDWYIKRASIESFGVLK